MDPTLTRPDPNHLWNTECLGKTDCSNGWRGSATLAAAAAALRTTCYCGMRHLFFSPSFRRKDLQAIDKLTDSHSCWVIRSQCATEDVKSPLTQQTSILQLVLTHNMNQGLVASLSSMSYPPWHSIVNTRMTYEIEKARKRSREDNVFTVG